MQDYREHWNEVMEELSVQPWEPEHKLAPWRRRLVRWGRQLHWYWTGALIGGRNIPTIDEELRDARLQRALERGDV
jgi:hypothetical protein